MRAAGLRTVIMVLDIRFAMMRTCTNASTPRVPRCRRYGAGDLLHRDLSSCRMILYPAQVGRHFSRFPPIIVFEVWVATLRHHILCMSTYPSMRVVSLQLLSRVGISWRLPRPRAQPARAGSCPPAAIFITDIFICRRHR